MNRPVASPDDVLGFWFSDSLNDPSRIGERNRLWFSPNDEFDSEIRRRFSATLAAAQAGELKRWQLSVRDTLALILLFDQFARNIYRGQAEAFANDHRSLALCRDALVRGHDRDLGVIERSFFYLPLEHAEDLQAQEKSLECFEQLHREAPDELRTYTANALKYAVDHCELIRRFGRFPHRNAILGRASTSIELAWLSEHRGGYGQG